VNWCAPCRPACTPSGGSTGQSRSSRSICACRVESVDLRLQTLEVSGQEILTKDKVSLRVNLSAVYRIADPVKARAELGNAGDYLYRTLQFGLRQTIGTRTLDVLLGDKDELDRAVWDYAVEKIRPHGLELETVGLKDVILPGEMKDILNQVVQAEKVAQANVIRRREETAATRSLLNTAKLMEENPLLLRLKELEALEKVVDKVERLTVFGGLDGVLREAAWTACCATWCVSTCRHIERRWLDWRNADDIMAVQPSGDEMD